MYAARGCERWMNEQPKVVGAGTSVNKELLKEQSGF
jgi:hypothetical protein